MNKYKVAIDARFITEKTVGISRYTINLIKSLCLLQRKYEIFCIVNTDHYKPLFSSNELCEISFIKATSRPLSITEHFEIPLILLKHRINLFHATSYITPIWVPCKFVYSILDTYHLLFPEGFSKFSKFYFNVVVKNAAKNAKHIITISESSKQDIVKYIISTKPMSVTYLAAEKEEPSEFCEKKIKDLIETPYILFLGNHRIHKNLLRVLEAYCCLLDTKIKIPNLIVNLQAEEKYLSSIKKKEYLENIKFIGFVPESQLSFLYSHATCLVTPSLYEGFGLFILEAMNYDIPIITSNVSSMPEVGGDAVRYVDPYSVKQITEAMQDILTNKELCNTLIERGRVQRSKFTWKKCAEQTNDIYEKILLG